MLKAELEQEVSRLRDVIMNAPEAFDRLTKEQKREIDNIFNQMWDEENPDSRFHAIGLIAAYILRGKL
ncbi:hypothetical protein DLL80_23790 [Salmonella enterica subsp. enterica serovar Newport]|uniref:Uncharacterized protein n=1 Tax=Salmonella newport TaxID=108619 RepID=A0A5V6RMH3_SALNE|nr:hypothetical protein [Salmonella enterica subsp. enterica serovar Newport]